MNKMTFNQRTHIFFIKRTEETGQKRNLKIVYTSIFDSELNKLYMTDLVSKARGQERIATKKDNNNKKLTK